jgi:hypothetical protein
MPYSIRIAGLYLMVQKTQMKGVLVDHYGILDVGNTMNLPNTGWQPLVIHQTPPQIRLDRLADTGDWKVLGKITDEPDAISRINRAIENSAYDLFGNNCEHFARYVATGRRESMQLQALGLVASLLAVVVILAMSGEGA